MLHHNKSFVLTDLLLGKRVVLLSLLYFVGSCLPTTTAIPVPAFELVADIRVGNASSLPDYYIPDDNGRVFFRADDGIHGEELWIYDHQQTRMVKDIRQGPEDSDVSHFADSIMQGIFYFRANDGVHGLELWRSDGTEDGTYMVKDIYEGEEGSYISIRARVFADKFLFFGASTEKEGSEPWVSDGTEAGTFMLKDLNPGQNSSNPTFSKFDNATVLFAAETTDWIDEMWTTDGTSEGTKFFTSLVPDADDIFDRKPAETVIIFGWLRLGDKWMLVAEIDDVGSIWTTGVADGQGTEMIYNNLDMYQGSASTIGGKVVFVADDGIHGLELWTTDGTAEGTNLVTDRVPGDYSVYYHPYMGPIFDNERVVLFGGESSGPDDFNLMVSDQVGNTRILANLTMDAPAGETVGVSGTDLMDDGRFLFSVASETQGSIWITDGTDDGTEKIVTINLTQVATPFRSSKFGNPKEIDGNGTILFTGVSLETGVELFQVKVDALRDPPTPMDDSATTTPTASSDSNTRQGGYDGIFSSRHHTSSLLLGMVIASLLLF